jgi:hypothetical protein
MPPELPGIHPSAIMNELISVSFLPIFGLADFFLRKCNNGEARAKQYSKKAAGKLNSHGIK